MKPGRDYRIRDGEGLPRHEVTVAITCPACGVAWRQMSVTEGTPADIEVGHFVGCQHGQAAFQVVNDGLRRLTDDEIREAIAKGRSC